MALSDQRRLYSDVLSRVTLPPFGNTNSDASIPFSVTLIMTQFD